MKENFFESVVGQDKKRIDPEQNEYEIIEATQLELIYRYGGDNAAAEWIRMNSKRFREILSDPKNNLVERLANEETREKAINEIQQKLNN